MSNNLVFRKVIFLKKCLGDIDGTVNQLTSPKLGIKPPN
jgi:hypothetical protein